jgi:hypothetical protein
MKENSEYYIVYLFPNISADGTKWNVGDIRKMHISQKDSAFDDKVRHFDTLEQAKEFAPTAVALFQNIVAIN